MLDKIQDYEKRLLDDRQRLLMLIQEYGEDSPELLQSRLEYFETELQYMNRQLEWLKKQQISRGSEASMVTADGQVPPMNPTVQSSYQQTPPVNPTVQSSYQQIPPVNPQVQSSYQQIPPVNPQVQSSYQQIPPVNPQVQSGYQQVPPVMQGRKDAGSGKKDMEQVIGKSLMGIFASVLIFISLILFSTLVLRELGDMAKLVLIYTVSFGFVITGLCKLRKERGNHFYLAVTGCGMGAVYLSLFLTNAYFGMIGELTLYLLLLVWAGGNCILAKYHSRIFQVIGQCGVTIAVIFGCALCVKLDSIEKLVVLSVFYVVAANVFYWISFARELSGNYVHHIFHGIDCYS